MEDTFTCVRIPRINIEGHYITRRCKLAYRLRFLNSACAIAVVDSKVSKVRGNFVEDEYYRWLLSFRKDL